MFAPHRPVRYDYDNVVGFLDENDDGVDDEHHLVLVPQSHYEQRALEVSINRHPANLAGRKR